MDKICGLVVWFNPEIEYMDNIMTYLNYIDKLIIVDNSENSHKDLLKDIGCVIEYIPNFNNLGIAEALNIGCKKAIELGYKYVLTMDQDSSFDSNMIEKYIRAFSKKSIEDREIAIFSPRISNNEDYGYVDGVITSGNILKLDLYNIVGGFDSNLFIDEVDFDFCFRLRNYNYKIYVFNDVYMNHKIGDTIYKKFLHKNIEVMNHNFIRKYYITRNRLIVRKRYPNYTRNYVNNILKDFIKVVLYEKDKIRKIRFMLKGFDDYRKNILGKL